MGRTQHILKGRIYIMKLFEYGKNGVTLKFKPQFTRNRRSGWQSNSIFPRLAVCLN